jgi:hypothetical protein
MIAGQCFGPDLFLITSNIGVLVFMLSMVRVLFEARYDMKQAGDLGGFLSALGNDTVTNTQSGLEKYTQDDTLSSGQQHNKDVTPSSPREQMSSSTFGEPHQLSPSRKNEVSVSSKVSVSEWDSTYNNKNGSLPSSLAQSGENKELAGISKRPEKLRRGQRPKGIHVVH